MSSKVVVLDLLNLFGFVGLRENTLHRLQTEPESTLRLKKTQTLFLPSEQKNQG